MKKTNKTKIILPILVVVVVLMLIFNKFLFQLKEGMDRAALPTQSKIYSFGQRILNIKNVIFHQDNIVEENQKLKEENMQLRLDSLRTDKIEEENERLLKLLEMKESKAYRDVIKFTRVIFSDANDINNRLYIDLGEKDGIRVDMIAVYGDYLVGKVSKTFDTYSVVDLISNPNSMVSSRLIKEVEKVENKENNKEANVPEEPLGLQNEEQVTHKVGEKIKINILGVARGSDEEDGLLYFQPSIYDNNITVGDEVYTSGLSNIYPEGIKIGKIEDINKKENYAYKTIKLRPGFESKDLRELIIINHRNNQANNN
nr:rod shape-determining protein MreC [uncultured Fusobacterium sp.]